MGTSCPSGGSSLAKAGEDPPERILRSNEQFSSIKKYLSFLTFIKKHDFVRDLRLPGTRPKIEIPHPAIPSTFQTVAR